VDAFAIPAECSKAPKAIVNMFFLCSEF
jgi:hypothetical protein